MCSTPFMVQSALLFNAWSPTCRCIHMSSIRKIIFIGTSTTWRVDSIESIRNAKRKAAELADTTLSLINSNEIYNAGSYYLNALEEVGRIKILQNDIGDEFRTTQEAIVENAGNERQQARDFRIQAALAYLGGEKVSCVVKNGTKFVIRKEVHGNELKRAVVSLKSKLAFL